MQRMNYENVMVGLNSGQYRKAYLVITETVVTMENDIIEEEIERLEVRLDNRKVMCFVHGGQLEDLPITVDLLLGINSYFVEME